KARPAAWRVHEGADLDTEAAGVVREAASSANVNDPDKEQNRKFLSIRAEHIKKAQKQVADLHIKANKADMDRPANQADPRWKAAYDAHVALFNAQQELQALWISAERRHAVLAAFRRGRDIETVDLGDLDSMDVYKEMTAVVKELLPKIADITRAK